jgi:hypothetical protein
LLRCTYELDRFSAKDRVGVEPFLRLPDDRLCGDPLLLALILRGLGELLLRRLEDSGGVEYRSSGMAPYVL